MKRTRGVLAVAFSLTVLAAAPRLGQAGQAASGRIDIYVDDKAFNLGRTRGSPGARVTSCSWLGEGKERTGVSCEKRLGKGWEEIWVEFVPEGAPDGKRGLVDIDLQGEWYRRQGAAGPKGDIRLVWADTVTVEGANIANGGFEEAAPGGGPAGWRFTGQFPTERYSRDGAVAHSGRSCVAVWYGCQARQKFAVEPGKIYRVSAWFRVLDPSKVVEPVYCGFEFPAERYAQEFEVVFKTASAARKASVGMLPLYNGYEWAVSSRWDDNNPSDLKMQRVLAEHGHKATWYLNAPGNWGDFTSTGRELLNGGNSIGGHSLTHPMLTYTSRNRIFEEVAGIRAEWEAAADTLVVSYAFSFCNFRNAMEGDAVQADVTRALERAGFYNIANGWYHDHMRTDMILSPIMPSDGKEIDGFAGSALANEGFRERHPNLSFSMHVWYKTPEAWAKFERQLDRYGRRPNWWYCNQNQYAAYRYQYLRSRLEVTTREGLPPRRTLRVRLLRPVMLDLNDPTPLTFEVRGVPGDEVLTVRCPGAEWAPAGREGGAFRFHLYHDRKQTLPKRIGLVQNPDNRRALNEGDVDPDFPDIRALLHFADGTALRSRPLRSTSRLRLALDNRSGIPLRGVRVTYRLPLAWKEGVLRRTVGTVAAGATYRDELRPTRLTDDYKYNSGYSFFVAQIDFVRDRDRGRLYATCRVKNTSVDRSYPQGGFLRLGPIDEKEFDRRNLIDRLAADIEAGGLSTRREPQGRSARRTTRPWILEDGTRLEWQADDSPFEPPFLDPEIIRTTGKWRGEASRYYILQGSLHSGARQPVRFRFAAKSIRHLFLNGEDVVGRPAELREGENKLVIVYHSGAGRSRYSAEHAGCFLRVEKRLEKPGTGARLRGLRFEPVKLP